VLRSGGAPPTSVGATLAGVQLIAAVVVTIVLLGLVAYGLRAEYGGRCSACRRRFARSTPPLWCLNGHRIHDTCTKRVMGRDVCSVCGSGVSDFRG
jgi:hypothetical protein